MNDKIYFFLVYVLLPIVFSSLLFTLAYSILYHQNNGERLILPQEETLIKTVWINNDRDVLCVYYYNGTELCFTYINGTWHEGIRPKMIWEGER